MRGPQRDRCDRRSANCSFATGRANTAKDFLLTDQCPTREERQAVETRREWSMALTEIRSEMAGSVLKILVTVDDIVEAGTPVMVLESMKMEIPIVAPFRGRVAEIFVVEAASVLGDHLMATLERVGLDGLT